MAQAQKNLAITQANLKSNFLPEKMLGYLKEFEKKIDLCEKYDEITRFDGNQ